MSFLKKHKFLLLAILASICFLGIRIDGYNGNEIAPIFEYFYITINEMLFTDNKGFWGVDILIYIFITVNIFVIIGLLLKNKIPLIISIVGYLCYWYFIYYSYNGIVELKYYFITSVPFLSVCLALIVISIKKLRQTNI